MYKINKDAFRRYFFWGINNPNELLEGILYYTYENNLLEGSQTKEGGREQQVIDSFVQATKPIYKQYYRFIELNNRNNIYNYKQEKEEELEKIIRKKIEELRNNVDEVITEEMIQNEIRKQEEQRNNYLKDHPDWEDWRKDNWIEETRNMPEKVRKKMEERGRKKLVIKDDDISYSISQRRKYAFIPEYAIIRKENDGRFIEYAQYNKKEWEQSKIPNNLETWGQEARNKSKENEYESIPNKLKHWTQIVAEILETLNKVEQEDPKAYMDLWLRTRQNRARNGTIKGITQEEIEWINKSCETVRVERLQEQEKENSEGHEIE